MATVPILTHLNLRSRMVFAAMRSKTWSTSLILAYLAYAGVYIFSTSFIMNEVRFFTLFDDAMISMRYARNLAEGYGLVWNPGGDKVEGFSNGLWMLFMALIHLLPLEISKTSVVVQAAGAACLAANCIVVHRLAALLPGATARVALAAAVVTGLYLPLNAWGWLGTEVAPLTLLVSLAAATALRLDKQPHRIPVLYGILGCAVLIRMDMAVMYVALWIPLLLEQRHTRKHLVWGVVILAATLGAPTLAR